MDRQRPGIGYRHLLLKRDIIAFLELLPDWNSAAVGLNAVVLAPGEYKLDGYDTHGVVHVCAWESDLWRIVTCAGYEEHREIWGRLGVPCEPITDEHGAGVLCRWDERTARSYQLLHVLLHELGHHHDRMTTRRQKRCGRGEPFAEAYALRHEEEIWDKYNRAFGL